MSYVMYIFPWVAFLIAAALEEGTNSACAKEVLAVSVLIVFLLWVGVFIGG